MPPQKKKPDAVALLKADHEKVAGLFEKFEKARRDRKAALALEICTELCVHTSIEEEIFYPACNDRIEDQALLEESYVEHDGAKVLIAELLASNADAEFYDAKMKVLSEMIEHHVEEEEKRSEGLFAQAKAAGLDMDELGAKMRARKTQLMAEFKGGKPPPPKTRSFSGHKLEQSRPIESVSDR